MTGAGGIGATSHANAGAGAPTISLTSTRAGSLVFGAGNDWDGAVARTVGTGQAMVHEYHDTVSGDDFSAQKVTAATGTAGSTTTVNDSAPTADRWNLVAAEAIPAASIPAAPETTRYSFTGGGDTPDLTLNGSNTVQERTLVLPNWGVVSIRASGSVWSYPNLHGDVVAVGCRSRRAPPNHRNISARYLYRLFRPGISIYCRILWRKRCHLGSWRAAGHLSPRNVEGFRRDQMVGRPRSVAPSRGTPRGFS